MRIGYNILRPGALCESAGIAVQRIAVYAAKIPAGDPAQKRYQKSQERLVKIMVVTNDRKRYPATQSQPVVIYVLSINQSP